LILSLSLKNLSVGNQNGALEFIVFAFWFVLPAYVANASPVVFGGGRPIDGGRKFLTDALSSDRERPFEDSVLVLPQVLQQE
jgi:hypothetical protein